MTTILGLSLVMAALAMLCWRFLARLALALVLTALCLPLAALAYFAVEAAHHWP
jgi:hypothetical protein